MVLPQVIPKDTSVPDPYKELSSFQTRLSVSIIDGVEFVIFVNDNSVWVGRHESTLVKQPGWGWGLNGVRPNPNVTHSYTLWTNQRHPIEGGTKVSDVVILHDYEEIHPISGSTDVNKVTFRAYVYGDGDRAGGLEVANLYIDRTPTGLTYRRIASFSDLDGWDFYNSRYAATKYNRDDGYMYSVREDGGSRTRSMDWPILGRPYSTLDIAGTRRVFAAERFYGDFYSIASSPSDQLMSEEFYAIGRSSGSHGDPAIAHKTGESTLDDPQFVYVIGSVSDLYMTGLHHRGRIWTSFFQPTSRGRLVLGHVSDSLVNSPPYQSAVTGAAYLIDYGSDRPYGNRIGSLIKEIRLVGVGQSVFVIIRLSDTDEFHLWYAEAVLGDDDIALWLDENREASEHPHWTEINSEDSAFSTDVAYQALNVVHNVSQRRLIISSDCNDGNYRVYQLHVPGDLIPVTPSITLPNTGSYDRRKDVDVRWRYFHQDNLPQTAYQIRNVANDEYLAGDGTWSANEQTIVSSSHEDTIVGTSIHPWSDTNGEIFRLTVRVRDSEGHWSSWSNELRITASEIDPATIIVPSSVSPTVSTVTWTTPGTSAQTHYRVQFKQDGSTVIDTGWVQSTDKTVTLPVKDEEYEIVVWWQNAEGLKDESVDSSGTNTKTVTFAIPSPVIGSPDVNWLDIDDAVVSDRGDGFHVGAIRAKVVVSIDHSAARVQPPDSAKIYKRRSDIDPVGSKELVGDASISSDGNEVSVLDHRLGTKRKYQWMAEIIGPGSYLEETAWGPA